MNSKTSSDRHDSNHVVAGRVREALVQTDCKALDPVAIEVQVDEGTVTLTGNVPSLEALSAAENAALRGQGVAEVRNDVLIEPM